jgi:hypothetical protein
LTRQQQRHACGNAARAEDASAAGEGGAGTGMQTGVEVLYVCGCAQSTLYSVCGRGLCRPARQCVGKEGGVAQYHSVGCISQHL